MGKDKRYKYKPPEPPGDLSIESKKLYDFYVGQGVKIRAPAQVKVFIEALRSLDLANEAREILKKEGLIGVSKRSGLSRKHPAFDVLKSAEKNYRKIWQNLELYDNFTTDEYGFPEDII